MEGLISAKVGGLALVSLVVLLVLRQLKPEWGALVRMAAAVAAAGFILTALSGVLSLVEELSSISGEALPADTWGILLRALGVAFLTEIAASICRDSGEGGLAGWVEMAGRVEILLLSFPLIRTVLSTVSDLLGGR